MLFLQVVTLSLVAVTMSLALAHALEFPGKMRLSRDNYIATQTIYYPGFSIGGFAEPIGILATLLLALVTPQENPAFVWTLVALIAIAAMHAVYWLVTHPVNRFWMTGTATGVAHWFFSFSRIHRSKSGETGYQDQWERLRDTWEHSHMVRAA